MASEHFAPAEEIVDGTYPLGRLIMRSSRTSIHETEFSEGESTVPAVVRIREAQEPEAEHLTQLLDKARHLTHPNLLKVYATGSCVMNGVPVFYIVMERADESLEAVLTERTLTEAETREMLSPTLEALEYLHKSGYAHSRLRPSNVLAVNDRLKLSSESIVPIEDGGSPDDDIRALGVLIVQALTQKLPGPDGLTSGDEQELPQPLADIARHCLDPDVSRRWAVEKVKARLHAPTPPADPEETAAQTYIPRLPEVPHVEDSNEGLPKWVFAAFAAVVVIVVLLAIVRSSASKPATAPPIAAAQQDQTPPRESVASAPENPEVSSPQYTAPPHPVQAKSPTAVPPNGKKASGWAVIVAAYRSSESAEKRMRDMTKKWPSFQIRVFESPVEKSLYLVVLGRNLSEDQAQALRQRAVQSGLPRDTYIKRVM